MRGKSRQNAENKQTFDLTGKIEIEIEGGNRKTRQNAENKQTFDLTGKVEIDFQFQDSGCLTQGENK